MFNNSVTKSREEDRLDFVMRINTEDLTLQRNYIEKYRFLIREYEQVKNKIHPIYKKAKDFYKAHDTCAKSFLKYYNRYKQAGKEIDLLPQKRGPRYKTRRPVGFIENKVIALRLRGNNRYEVVNILKPRLHKFTPSPSGVYNIFKRRGLNRLNPVMKQNRRSIIKEKRKNRYMLFLVNIDTRISWEEVVKDIRRITVMFTALKCLNILNDHYNIKFEEILTDNGSEFGTRVSKTKQEHPLERLLIELEIKHRYTRPYKPQTNGKVERLWRTLEDDMLRDTHYDTLEELKAELIQYLYYYNHERPHQGINGDTPIDFRNKLLPN